MNLDEATRNRITDLIEGNDIVLFMKGDRAAPQCGFSATVIGLLDSYVSDYATVDVLSNPDIREGIKVFSSWPTIPQLYVKGEFIGGCDIIQELAGSGELFETLGVEPPPEVVPNITITAAAAEALKTAAEQHAAPGMHLHLSIDAGFRANLTMAPEGALDVTVEDRGIPIMLDRLSAQRAEGVTIDLVETPGGAGFRVDNPNAPTARDMSVKELASLIESGEPFELLDVRTPEEIAIAALPGSVMLTEQEARRIASLPSDTRLVFICHHGNRSAEAAHHFASQGFRSVYNVAGGIDAWSQQIDPKVRRY